MIRSEKFQLFLRLGTISYYNVHFVYTPLFLAVACELMFSGEAQQCNPSRHDSYEWQVQIRGRPPSHVRGMSTSGGNLIGNLRGAEVKWEMDGTDRRTEWSRGPADWKGEFRKGRCCPSPTFGFDLTPRGLKGWACSLVALARSHFDMARPLYKWKCG